MCRFILIRNHSLALAVGAFYGRKYFPIESKVAAIKMVNEILKEFEHLLKEADWMDETTRQSALRKLKKLITQIGYPDELSVDRNIVNHYNKLEIHANNYFQSILNMIKFDLDAAFDRLRKSVIKNDWIYARPASLNAYYVNTENLIGMISKNANKYFSRFIA